MLKFAKSVADLMTLVSADEAAADEIQAAARAVCSGVDKTSQSELDASLSRLTDSIATAEMPGAAVVALCCGAIVERGGNPDIALDAILSRLPETLTAAQLFAEACEEAAADNDDRLDAPENRDEGDDDRDPVEKFGEQIALQLPNNANAYNAVEPLGSATIALLSRSPAGRKKVRAKYPELIALASDLAPYHPRASFLDKIFNVLDDERMIVLHPHERKGFRIRLNGIGTNFELFILLDDALIGDPSQGWLAGKKPDPNVVAACKDRPAEVAGGKSVVSNFNLFNWEALRPDGTLPQPSDYSSSEYWIWMEGIPADICSFEGQRVILLGPPPYERILKPGRCFEGMIASLQVDSQMNAAEVDEWLKKLGSAPR